MFNIMVKESKREGGSLVVTNYTQERRLWLSRDGVYVTGKSNTDESVKIADVGPEFDLTWIESDWKILKSVRSAVTTELNRQLLLQEHNLRTDKATPVWVSFNGRTYNVTQSPTDSPLSAAAHLNFAGRGVSLEFRTGSVWPIRYTGDHFTIAHGYSVGDEVSSAFLVFGDVPLKDKLVTTMKPKVATANSGQLPHETTIMRGTVVDVNGQSRCYRLTTVNGTSYSLITGDHIINQHLEAVVVRLGEGNWEYNPTAGCRLPEGFIDSILEGKVTHVTPRNYYLGTFTNHTALVFGKGETDPLGILETVADSACTYLHLGKGNAPSLPSLSKLAGRTVTHAATVQTIPNPDYFEICAECGIQTVTAWHPDAAHDLRVLSGHMKLRRINADKKLVTLDSTAAGRVWVLGMVEEDTVMNTAVYRTIAPYVLAAPVIVSLSGLPITVDNSLHDAELAKQCVQPSFTFGQTPDNPLLYGMVQTAFSVRSATDEFALVMDSQYSETPVGVLYREGAKELQYVHFGFSLTPNRTTLAELARTAVRHAVGPNLLPPLEFFPLIRDAGVVALNAPGYNNQRLLEGNLRSRGVSDSVTLVTLQTNSTGHEVVLGSLVTQDVTRTVWYSTAGIVVPIELLEGLFGSTVLMTAESASKYRSARQRSFNHLNAGPVHRRPTYDDRGYGYSNHNLNPIAFGPYPIIQPLGNGCYSSVVVVNTGRQITVGFLGKGLADLVNCMFVETDNLLVLDCNNYRRFKDVPAEYANHVFAKLLQLIEPHYNTDLNNVWVPCVLVSVKHNVQTYVTTTTVVSNDTNGNTNEFVTARPRGDFQDVSELIRRTSM